MTTTPSAPKGGAGEPLGPGATWCVLIHFEEEKVTYLVHIPTEEQQRGYHNDRLYPAGLYDFGFYHLKFFADTATPDEAKAKAKQLLLEYVQVSV